MEDNILPEPGEGFISTPYVEHVTERALAYLGRGTRFISRVRQVREDHLAFHVAAKLGRRLPSSTGMMNSEVPIL